MSTIDLPVTFEAGPLSHEALNANFAAVKSALNELLAYVEQLQEDISPTVLSGYATVAQINDHISDSSPHSGMLAWGSGTALAGSDYISGNPLRVEAGTVTLAGGAGTFTYGSAFSNGVLSVQVSNNGADNGVGFSNVALADVDLAGTGTDVVFVTVIGW